jgi:fused signal recognition particle receptor
MVLSLFDLVAADVAPSPGSIAPLVGIVLFFVVFGVLGFLYLKKMRAQRIDALATELERPTLSDGQALPAQTSTPPELVPKAQDLVDAEKKALLARAVAEAAAREAQRAATAAQDNDDDDARKRAADAKAREVEAAQKLSVAADEAKSLRLALGKTRDGIMGRLTTAIGGKTIDASVLDDVESVLFTADIGARTAERLLAAVKQKLSKKELTSIDRIEETLRAEATAILASVEVKPLVVTGAKPRVVLVLGVNGAGKTTTIGKLASQLTQQGHKVLLGAGDTFRAAAAEQLEVWGQRANCPVVRGKEGGDPSSVIFDAVKRGVDEGADLVICDTAGRLHTKTDLMDELKKVRRVVDKAMPGAPHETWMVLDATNGQNAITQAKTFKDAMEITGIVITKLDGSAKGGVILGICDELKVPVRYIGVGEKLEDLRPFDPAAFVAALYDDADTAAAD